MPFKHRSVSKGMGAWTVAQLGEFYAQNLSGMKSHALRILRDSARSEEVVQEAVLRVLLAAPELESEKHALGYVHRTIENICVDIFRAEGRRPNLVLLDEVSGELEHEWNDSGDYSETISAADDAAIIRQAIALLSPAERAALVMWEVEGRTTKEIAKELGVKESSVRHTVSRARASLRQIMSELIVDKDRGLTALDMLSTAYRKGATAVKKGSKIALSVFLVLFAFLGFNSLPTNNPMPVVPTDGSNVSDKAKTNGEAEYKSKSDQREKPRIDAPDKKKLGLSAENARGSSLSFPGLNEDGVPTGFTIADSSGFLGSAFFTERPSFSSETEFSFGQIIKTDAGAASILIAQTFTIDSGGLQYRPAVSFGQNGRWIPTLGRIVGEETTRLVNGNYLFTAYIAVESAVESPIEIIASTEGRDLDVAPRQVITRVVFDQTKTKVLAQAIYVIEEGAN